MHLPGSRCEHELQTRYGTEKRARGFYGRQVLDHLNPGMREFIARQEMVFIATAEVEGGRKPERWVLVEVEEAYIHCSKHIPLLKPLRKPIHWGTDDEAHKGDFFGAKDSPRPLARAGE